MKLRKLSYLEALRLIFYSSTGLTCTGLMIVEMSDELSIGITMVVIGATLMLTSYWFIVRFYRAVSKQIIKRIMNRAYGPVGKPHNPDEWHDGPTDESYYGGRVEYGICPSCGQSHKPPACG